MKVEWRRKKLRLSSLQACCLNTLAPLGALTVVRPSGRKGLVVETGGLNILPTTWQLMKNITTLIDDARSLEYFQDDSGM